MSLLVMYYNKNSYATVQGNVFTKSTCPKEHF